MTTDRFQASQDRYFEKADVARFEWATRDPGFAPVEDGLLVPRLATLPFPCLEIGCGEGINLARLAASGAPVGIDRHLDKASFAARAIPAARLAVADAVALPFRNGAFAGVLIRDLLHHLPDPRRATAEAARVLAPGGTLLLFEPNRGNPLVALQTRLVPAEAAARRSSPASVRALLDGLPLTDVEVEMAQGLPLRRVFLHHRFGLPALGRLRPVAAVLRGFERAGERLLPRARWSYIVVRARRR